MKKKNKIIITSFILIFISLLFTLGAIYLKKVAIYQPFSISVNGITPKESNLITINGITPLNRIIKINYNSTNNAWQENTNTFYKKIEIFIPDTLELKARRIFIKVNTIQFNLTFKDLQMADFSAGYHHYYLPAKVCSKFSLGKLAIIIMQWQSVKYFFIILLVTGILLLMLLIILKIRKNGFSLKPFFLSFKIKPQVENTFLKKALLWLKITGFSILAAFGIFYGYLLIKYTMASYITTILFITFIGFIIWIILKIIFKISKASVIKSKRITKGLFIFLLLLFCLETILRIIGVNKSHNEKLGLYYTSGYVEPKPANRQYPHLNIHPKYYTSIHVSKEFSYEIKCNADGIRDIDHSFEKEKNEYRILCLGNSFTEGIGTPQDSTWPKLLEDRINQISKRKVTVINAGISGSDPFYEYMLLEEKMLNYNPDLVLVALCNSDIKFYKCRGGFERFTKDGVHYLEGPAWEKIYAVSYVFRIFIDNVLHYKMLMPPEKFNANTKKALLAMEECIKRFYYLSIQHDFKLALVFFDKSQYERYVYAQLIDQLKKENLIPVIDLFEYNKNIIKLDSNEYRKHYFWPIDKHFNSRGYNLMAEGVEWNLKEMCIIDSLYEK